jgi:Protein of unknown function (DUF3775)
MLNHLTISDIENITVLAEQAIAPRSREGRSAAHLVLRRAIERLSFEARLELKALMWVGRGEDLTFRDALEHGRRISTEDDASYIAAKALALPFHLRDGLTEIGMGREDSRPAAA